ncbi:MAG: sensor histidine kinase [Arenicellales bacterium]
MKSGKGIQQRLVRAFLLQALLISLTAVIGVYAAGSMIKDVLISQALEEEANYYWDLHGRDPKFPLPDTRNLTGYLDSSEQQPPAEFTTYSMGFHDLPSDAEFTTLYVNERNGERLYLLFDGERVGKLALFFGLLPLSLVLITLYLVAWIAWRTAGHAISPVIWLAHKVDSFDPDPKASNVIAADDLPSGTDREVLALVSALNNLNERITAFIEREHQFTRDASHELRSPLTVIKIAADMLLSEQELSEQARNSVMRIRRNASDMEELMEALLLLAREFDLGLSVEDVCVNDVLDEEIERINLSLADKPIRTELHHECRLHVKASEKALAMLLSNLLRNAAKYTEKGLISVTVSDSGVMIEDSGVGMSKEELENVFTRYYRVPGTSQSGHGVGLSIVKRLSDRFGWNVKMDSELEHGTRVTVGFTGPACQ